ncbi:hypothetical protein GOP47_0001232 [Adiantum capillus-veneris]|uniref:Pentatricopeptide repeat-containing protein n=1 Tax=Adiantum capillus-veneris TaxID=13818 RepID=A0A9D4VF08_ADICA|nr:hypothetical protein GOP47_0001232 [Adiantum capillus-veneris]
MEPLSLHKLFLYHHQGKKLFRNSAYCILQGCIRDKDVTSCRILHCFILFHELDSIASHGDHLIRFFGSHGHLLEASLVFFKAVQKSSYSWEALISAHVNQGEYLTALALYDVMPTSPSKCIYLATLRACGTKEDIDKGRLIHAEVVKACLDSDLVVESSLLNMYAQCGELEDALKVFDQWAADDVVMWNTMIAAYTAHGHSLSSLKLFEKMEQKLIEPTEVTCVSLLKACAKVGLLMEGWYIHDRIIRRGFDSNVIVRNILVDIYAKCKKVEDSDRMFCMSCQNLVSWNTKISGYVQLGREDAALDLFKKLQQQGLKPDKVTFLAAIKACTNPKSLWTGQLIHDEAQRQGFGGDLAVNNALIHMYSKGGNLELARKVFDSLSTSDMISWGTMISGYVQHGCHLPAFNLVSSMLSRGIKPEKVIFLCLMRTCGDKEALEDGHLVHYQIIDHELENDSTIGSTLIDMYAKCNSLDEARHVFDTLPSRDVVSWSVMIAGHVEQGNELLAFDLFVKMQQEDVKPDRVTYLCLLRASGKLKALGQGKQIHQAIIRNQCKLDVAVGSTLVDMYVKCSDLEEARQVFDKLPVRNEVSWSVMIGGYLQHEQNLPALDLFQQLLKEELTLDKVTLLGILKAAGSVGAVGPGMAVHDHVIRNMMNLDVMVYNTLIDMYAKCGRVKEAYKVFECLPNRDGISWNALIAADTQNENYDRVIQAFQDMKGEGFRPAESTFTSVLASCCQAGRVSDARQHFETMIRDYGITPTVEHLNCMVDLLGRAAHFDEARNLIETMSIPPDVTTWLSLLTACKSYKNVEFGRVCFNEAMRLDPNGAAAYVLLSDVYADANMWDDVRKLQVLQQRTRSQQKLEVAGMKVQFEFSSSKAQPMLTTSCRLLQETGHSLWEDDELAHHKEPSSDVEILCNSEDEVIERSGNHNFCSLCKCENSRKDSSFHVFCVNR